ncbi:ABC transporter ATP-binding protein [Alicyclobacillus sp. ALC3]|uniref:ABC transporter ATP-binding protein n=1 Tax=Alicyclobacillus sp. ALC3 TaxID=2796143 RepID=UPI0023782CD4|nr:ABC transporter ATP-binding protein [Alicyclobacillus sp. ALC3]WDL99095.1 ABC transporter ATP-binding protein [Alicyclobacillus sp. ALC3]
MLQVVNLAKHYGSFHAASDVSFEVGKGEFVTILGPSGSGKSTILRMVAGLTEPTSGRILIDGKDVTSLSPQKRDIGLVFQSYALFPNMTVAQNVAYPLRVRKWNREDIRVRVAELLELVGLAHRASYYPEQLSGGERQRVALVRALAFRPPLLLLDEPLSALDAKVRERLRASLKEIQSALQVTTVMVTHDQEEALELSDQVVVMNQGRVEQVGTPAMVYYSPRTEFAASFVGQSNAIAAVVKRTEPWANGMRKVSLYYHGATFTWLVDEADATVGNMVTLFVRPESVRLTRGAESELNGIVRTAQFMGPTTRYKVEVAGQLLTVDAMSSLSQEVQVGDVVGLVLCYPGLAEGTKDSAPAAFETEH